MRFSFCLFLLCAIITGCQDAISMQTAMSSLPQSSSSKSIQKEDIHETLRHFAEASTDEPTSYVKNLRYTLNDFVDIQLAAKKHGIENPFIPTEGIASDYVMSVDAESDVLKITYPHFSIQQSTKELASSNNGSPGKIVKSDRGHLNWVYSDDTPQFLFTVRDGIFITISSAKPFEEKEFEKVMESLVPLFDRKAAKTIVQEEPKKLLHSKDGTLASIVETLVNEKSVYEITWSPNRKYITFALGNPEDSWGYAYCWMVGQSEPTALTIPEERIGNFYWSPNSEYVLMDTGSSPLRAGYLIAVRDLKVAEPFRYRGAIFSPDSKFLAMGTPSDHDISDISVEPSQAFDLSLYNTETNELRVIVATDNVHNLLPLKWANEKTLIYKKVRVSKHEETEHSVTIY